MGWLVGVRSGVRGGVVSGGEEWDEGWNMYIFTRALLFICVAWMYR